MHLDPWTLGLQAVNALVLVWLLSRLLFRPVAGLIQARQGEIEHALAQASAARQAAAAQQADAALGRAALAGQLEQLRSSARQQQAVAAQAAQAALDQALQVRRQAAEQELAGLREAARRAGQEDALAFSLDLARRLLQRLPDDALVMPFLPGLAQALAKLPASLLQDWCAAREPAELRSARPLDSHELEVCRQSLQQAVARAGALPPLQPVVVPELLAGLALVAPHLHIANHLRQDWECLRDSLGAGGAEAGPHG